MPCLGLRTGLSKRNLILDVCVACCICKIEVHEPGVNAMAGPRGVRKNKRNRMVKEPGHQILPNQRAQSLDMKYYLVTGGLSSVPEASNKSTY